MKKATQTWDMAEIEAYFPDLKEQYGDKFNSIFTELLNSPHASQVIESFETIKLMNDIQKHNDARKQLLDDEFQGKLHSINAKIAVLERIISADDALSKAFDEHINISEAEEEVYDKQIIALEAKLKALDEFINTLDAETEILKEFKLNGFSSKKH